MFWIWPWFLNRFIYVIKQSILVVEYLLYFDSFINKTIVSGYYVVNN